MNTKIQYLKFVKNDVEERKEKIQTLLMELRKSGDHNRDAELYDLIRRVGRL